MTPPPKFLISCLISSIQNLNIFHLFKAHAPAYYRTILLPQSDPFSGRSDIDMIEIKPS